MVHYLRKQQHGVATALGLINVRSPRSPQWTSSGPTVACCKMHLHLLCNKWHFLMFPKMPHFQKSKKRSQKNLNTNNDSNYNRGRHTEPVNRTLLPEQLVEDIPFMNSASKILNNEKSCISFFSINRKSCLKSYCSLFLWHKYKKT